MNFDDYYMHMHLGLTPPSREEAEEPEEDEKPSYFSSYVSVYVKPDPKPPPPARPPTSRPSNTGGISLPPPPVRPPASRPSHTGGVSLPPPPRHDPRPDVSRAERPTDDSDSDRMRPGRIVEELQDERPDHVDPLGQSANEIYDNVTDLYYQLYIEQGRVRTDDLAESGQDPDSDWYAAQRAYRSIDRYMNRLLQPGQGKSAASSQRTVLNASARLSTEKYTEEMRLHHVLKAEQVMRQEELDSRFEFELWDGTSVDLSLPKGLSVEDAQILATRLLQSTRKLLLPFEAAGLLGREWAALWRDDTARQREEAYKLFSRALETLDGPRGDIQFYSAARNVSFLFSLGEYHIHRWANFSTMHLEYSGPIFDSAMDLLDRIGEELMEFNMGIIFEHIEAASAEETVLISPLAYGDDPISPPIEVNSALEWDIHMVWREQLKLEEIVATYQAEDADQNIDDELAVITDIMTLNKWPVLKLLGDLFDGTASDAVRLVIEVLEEDGEDEEDGETLNFSNLTHRRGIGIAMAFQAHDKTNEEFKAYFREMLARGSEELPPEISILD